MLSSPDTLIILVARFVLYGMEYHLRILNLSNRHVFYQPSEISSFIELLYDYQLHFHYLYNIFGCFHDVIVQIL